MFACDIAHFFQFLYELFNCRRVVVKVQFGDFIQRYLGFEIFDLICTTFNDISALVWVSVILTALATIAFGIVLFAHRVRVKDVERKARYSNRIYR